MAVVLRGHRLAVGAGGADGHQVAAAALVHGELLDEHVGTLAHGAHHVIDFLRLVRSEVLHAVIGLVHRRAHQFGHAAVDDGELLVGALLDVEHAADERTAGRDEAAPRLEVDERTLGQLQMPAEHLEPSGEIRHGQVVGMLVVDTQATAHVDVAHRTAAPLQAPDQFVDPVAQRRKIPHVQDLRTDVEMQPAVLHMAQGESQVHHAVHLLVVDAELVLRQARGDARVGVRPDIRVDAQAHGRHDPHLARQGVDHLQFRGRLHVEAGDARLQAEPDLVVALPHAGKHDALRREAGIQRGADFPAAHAVGAESARGNLRQDARIVVRLDGIVHPEVRIAVQLRLHRIEGAAQQG